MSAAALADRARQVATSEAPLRERLGALIELAAEARRLEDPAERRRAELAVFEAARPLLEDEERPLRAEASAPNPEPLGDGDLAREVAAMNARRARREALLPSAAEVPVEGPRWAARVLDLGEEIVGVHRETGAAYRLELAELEGEELPAVLAARVLRAGGSPAEAARAVGALRGLVPGHAVARVLRELEGVDRR